MSNLRTRKTRARSEEDKAALRDTILAESVRLYADVGYENFSMRKLGARVGYTATTIYSYFSNKDELLDVLLDQALREFVDYLASDIDDPIGRIRDVGRRMIDFGYNNSAQYDLMFVHRPVFLRETDERSLARRAEVLEPLYRILGGTAGPKLGDAMWALGHGLVTLSRSQPDFTHDRAIAALDEVLDQLVTPALARVNR